MWFPLRPFDLLGAYDRSRYVKIACVNKPKCEPEGFPTCTQQLIYGPSEKLRLARLRRVLVFVPRHEPVLINAERAIGIVGAHVRGVVHHDGGPVTVLEIFLTRDARSFKLSQWNRHGFQSRKSL